MYKKYFGIISLAVVFAIPSMAAAQTGTAVSSLASTSSGLSGATTLSNTTSCFDYYRFDSVQVDISSPTLTVTPGSSLLLTGKVVNSNSYPIVDGSVYVKIFRLDKDMSVADPNGPQVVDQFIVIDHLNIAAGSSTPITSSWKVPQQIIGGNYQVATFFQTADSFEVTGLTFTNDVVGNTMNFSVNSLLTKTIEFNKASVTVDGDPYFFATPPPTVSDGEATVTAKLVNTTATTQTIPVTWRIYSWDGLSSSRLLNTSNASVIVPAGESVPVTLTVSDTSHAVYYIVAEATYQDSKSLLDIRFVRPSVDETRMSFAGLVSPFPLQVGTTSTILACVHSMTQDLSSGGKVVLSLTDSQGNPITSYTYQGGVTGNVMGVKDNFIPKQSYNNVTLNASLYQNGNLVSSNNLTYDCKDIDPSACSQSGSSSIFNNPFFDVLLAIILIAFVIILVLLFRKKKITAPISSPVALFIAAAGITALCMVPNAAHADSVVWANNFSGQYNLNTHVDINPSGVICWKWGASQQWAINLDNVMSNPGVSVTYNASVVNAATGAVIADNSTVPVGTKLILNFDPHYYNDVFWWGTGYYYGTPYGMFLYNSAAPSSSDLGTAPYYFDMAARGGGECNSPAEYVYIGLSVAPPPETVSVNSSTLQCGLATEYSNGSVSEVCTAVAGGSTVVAFNYGATQGSFYGEVANAAYGNGTVYTSEVPLSNGGAISIPSQTIWVPFTVVAPTPPPPPIAPTVTLNANPTAVVPGGNTTLTWTTANTPTSCIASTNTGNVANWNGPVSVGGGPQPVGPITADTTFNLTCENGGGTGTAPPVPITALTLNLGASPSSVPPGGQTKITWSSNASSCAAAASWTSQTSPSSNQTVTVSNPPTTYSMTCQDGGVTITKTVTVDLLPPPTVFVGLDPTANGTCSATLTWSISNMSASDLQNGGSNGNIGCRAGGWNNNGWVLTPNSSPSSPLLITGTPNQKSIYTLTCTSSAYPNDPVKSTTSYTWPKACVANAPGTGSNNNNNYIPY